MAKHIVQCRVCKLKFNATLDTHETLWIMPSKGMYYHTSCYKSWKQKMTDPTAEMSPEGWHKSAKEYLSKEVRMSVDWAKFESQWKTFSRPSYKPEMSAKGIYFALRYIYDIKHMNTNKAEGGIGLVPYVYAESCQYWANEERRCAGIIARITEQARQYAGQEHIVVKGKKKENPMQKARFNLDEVEDD